MVLSGAVGTLPAVAYAAEPTTTPPPAPAAPPAHPSTELAPHPPLRRYLPYIFRGNAIPAPYAIVTLGYGANLFLRRTSQAELNSGFAVGLTSHLWVDGSFGTLRLAPAVIFHSAQVGVNALLLDTPGFELDTMLHVSGPTDDGRPVEQVEPGFYTVARVERAIRVDTYFGFDANPGPTTTYGLRVPTAVAFQLVEHIFLSLSSGVTVGNFADAPQSTAIPAGITLGWGDYLPTAEVQAIALVPSLAFPQLVKPWANEPFRPDVLTATLTFYYVWKY